MHGRLRRPKPNTMSGHFDVARRALANTFRATRNHWTGHLHLAALGAPSTPTLLEFDGLTRYSSCIYHPNTHRHPSRVPPVPLVRQYPLVCHFDRGSPVEQIFPPRGGVERRFKVPGNWIRVCSCPLYLPTCTIDRHLQAGLGLSGFRFATALNSWVRYFGDWRFSGDSGWFTHSKVGFTTLNFGD